MEENKRKNYTTVENETFLECLQQFKDKIENKTTNAVSNIEKQTAWDQLTVMFNSMPGVSKRKCKQLKDLHKNLKRKANKNRADERVKVFKTGGGSEPSVISSLDERMIALGSVKTPLVNVYDSDYSYHSLTANSKCFFFICARFHDEFIHAEI